jgi:hypothetical protein
MCYFALSLVTITSIAAAQGTVVVPSLATKKDPSFSTNYPFYGHATNKGEGRALYMYNTADIPQVSMAIKSLALRSSSGGTSAGAALTITVDMSVSPNDPTAASGTYANNHGANKRRMFSGTINLPARGSAPWPQQWETPITLTTPFVYARSMGKSLVVEITSTTSSTVPWNVEASKVDAGTRTTESAPSVCPFAESPPRTPGSMNIHYPRLGMQWWMRYLRYPHNTPSFNASILVVGSLGGGMKWLGLTLPINLRTGLGLPSSGPNCVLATNLLFSIPMIYTTNATPTRGTIEIPRTTIPNVPALGNAVIYSQPLSIDTDAVTKQPKIHTGWANKHRIGTEIGPDAATVFRTGDNASATGTVRAKEAATLRIAY